MRRLLPIVAPWTHGPVNSTRSTLFIVSFVSNIGRNLKSEVVKPSQRKWTEDNLRLVHRPVSHLQFFGAISSHSKVGTINDVNFYYQEITIRVICYRLVSVVISVEELKNFELVRRILGAAPSYRALTRLEFLISCYFFLRNRLVWAKCYWIMNIDVIMLMLIDICPLRSYATVRSQTIDQNLGNLIF